MSTPSVSVVIPSYGRPEPLKRCLAALARQTLPAEAFEVVVVDDGSPEPVEAVLTSPPPTLRMRLVRQDNAGPASARNRGAREAMAPLLAFTDDDCQPQPDWLARLLAGERANPGSLIGGRTINGLHDDLFATTSQLINDIVYEHFNPDPDHATFFASNNILCRRDRFLGLGGFDEGFPRAGGEDRDFCNRWLATGGRLVWQPEALISHHHAQTLRRFLNLHYRYGQGAHSYQSQRQARGTGSLRDDMSFHRLLPGRVWRRLGRPPGLRRSLRIGGALVLWQLAYATGYLRAS